MTDTAGINLWTLNPDALSNAFATASGISQYLLTATLVSVPPCDAGSGMRPIERVRDLIVPGQLVVRT
ncbi:MAG: hypothetical protein NVS4B3_06970 [Gemmatimonadaceae bacterium]